MFLPYFFSGRQNLISRISGSRPTENVITATAFRRLPTLSDRRTVPSPPGRTALYRTCPACLMVLIHLGLQIFSSILYASAKLSAFVCHTPGTPLRCRMPGMSSSLCMRCTWGGTGAGTVIAPVSLSCSRTAFLRNICLNRSRQHSSIRISFRLIFVYLLKWLFFSRFSLAACTLRMASKADLDFMRSMTNLRWHDGQTSAFVVKSWNMDVSMNVPHWGHFRPAFGCIPAGACWLLSFIFRSSFLSGRIGVLYL